MRSSTWLKSDRLSCFKCIVWTKIQTCDSKQMWCCGKCNIKKSCKTWWWSFFQCVPPLLSFTQHPRGVEWKIFAWSGSLSRAPGLTVVTFCMLCPSYLPHPNKTDKMRRRLCPAFISCYMLDSVTKWFLWFSCFTCLYKDPAGGFITTYGFCTCRICFFPGWERNLNKKMHLGFVLFVLFFYLSPDVTSILEHSPTWLFTF